MDLSSLEIARKQWTDWTNIDPIQYPEVTNEQDGESSTGNESTQSAPSPRIRSSLRLVGWNVLLLIVGLASIACVGEIWLRVTTPFMYSPIPEYFHPKVGLILKPNAEIRSTNGLDFWTISRTYSLGFLDREPPTPEPAAASCHITMIGDSFVEAREVPIADKFHVRLEDWPLAICPA